MLADAMIERTVDATSKIRLGYMGTGICDNLLDLSGWGNFLVGLENGFQDTLNLCSMSMWRVFGEGASVEGYGFSFAEPWAIEGFTAPKGPQPACDAEESATL